MYLFGRNHSGSFPTLLQFVAPCGTAYKTVGWLFLLWKQEQCLLFLRLYCQVKQFPPSQLHMYIVKKYCCQCPHPACKRWNFPYCSRSFPGLSIDFRRWMKAGIKDGTQFVSAKWISFSASVVWNVLLVPFDHCRWLLTPSLLTGSALAPAWSALS